MQHRESLQLSSILVVLEVKTLPDPPRGPRGAQEGRRWVPGGSPGSPGGAPRPSRGTPGAPEGRPREPQGSPKVTQELPEAPPRGENRGPNAPKIDFEADFGREPHSKAILDRFSMEFPPKSLATTTGESIVNCVEKLRRSGHRSTKRCCQNHRFT